MEDSSLVRDIERMILYVGQNVRPRSLMESLHRDLTYLANQARRNPDRTPPEFNQVRWERFLDEFKKTGLFPQFKKQVGDWARFEAFVTPKPKFLRFRIVGNTDESTLRTWEAKQFFESVLRDYIRRAPGGPNPLIATGLRYLIKEASLPYPKRDHKAIALAWVGIQPELRDRGVLTRYRREPALIDRIKTFVRG